MLKRVDNAVYDAMTAGPEVETGIGRHGLRTRAWATRVDEQQPGLITERSHARWTRPPRRSPRKLVVHDYMSDGCPRSF
jgi:basic membrane protein A